MLKSSYIKSNLKEQNRENKKELGAVMIEYVLVVASVSLFAVAGLQSVSNSMLAEYQQAAEVLAYNGDSGSSGSVPSDGSGQSSGSGGHGGNGSN